MGIYQSAGLTAQVPIVKSAKRHKQNIKTVRIQKKKERVNKNIYGRNKQNQRSTRSKGLLNPEKIQVS